MYEERTYRDIHVCAGNPPNNQSKKKKKTDTGTFGKNTFDVINTTNLLYGSKPRQEDDVDDLEGGKKRFFVLSCLVSRIERMD